MFSFFTNKTPKDNVFTVAFYNLDNLFDIYDDPDTLDDEFTPQGEKRWTLRRYKNKITKIGDVLLQLGIKHSTTTPVLIGLAEVENKEVLLDLINSKKMRPHYYDFAHFDSPDERGIDVALLYQKKYFELLDAKKYPLLLFDEDGNRDYTRDMLLVKGRLNGELLYIIVNHWPSRRSGLKESEIKRITAAKRVHEIIADVHNETPEAKIIIMGDFNDGPHSVSIEKHLVTDDFYNPMAHLKDTGNGTSTYNDEWFLFDQIIFSKNFFEKKSHTHTFKYAEVFDPKFVRTWRGKRKNKPFRTYVGRWHQGGYSDHFPVFAYVEKNE
ncbi:MAG TPA: endonuclease [Saprospiraceae bacterium]|nr:endonuclease [Saprospiraceae bacterium]